MYPVFQHLVIGDSLKILAPNCLITHFSAFIILTRIRDGVFPYISFFYWLFTVITLGLQCQRLFLRLQKLWFNHSKHHSCSHKAVKENKSSANLGLVSRPGKIAPKNKPSNLKTFGHGSSIITYKVSSVASYPWYVIAALLHSARSPQCPLIFSCRRETAVPCAVTVLNDSCPTVPPFSYLHAENDPCLQFLNIFLTLTLFPCVRTFLFPRNSAQETPWARLKSSVL